MYFYVTSHQHDQYDARHHAGALLKEGQGAAAPNAAPNYKSIPKCSVKWFHCAKFVLVISLCLAFSGADIELRVQSVLERQL